MKKSNKMPTRNVIEETSLSLVVFLDKEPIYVYAATILRRIFDEGHCMTVFDKDARLLYDSHPSTSPQSEVNTHPKSFLRQRLLSADAVFILTENPTYEIPECLYGYRELLNGRGFSWPSYGVSCLVFQAAKHSRKTAIDLRLLLDDSYYPLVGRVLPRPCVFSKIYNVDPSYETERPCI